MMSTKRVLLAALAGATMLTAPETAFARAGDFTSLYVFGDSLSDPGNLGQTAKKLFGYYPVFAQPYYNGRPSNGITWGEYLPGLIGVDKNAVKNFAISGAETGVDLQTGSFWAYVNSNGVERGILGNNQVGSDAGGFVKDYRIPKGALVSINGGVNDFVDAANTYLSNNPSADANTKKTELDKIAQAKNAASIENISTAIKRLNAVGGETFTVMNIPDIWKGDSRVPDTYATEIAKFNADLPAKMTTLANELGVRIIIIDASALYDDVAANPGKYGLTSGLSRCIDYSDLSHYTENGYHTVTGNCGSTVNADGTIDAPGIFRWDNTHLTTAGNKILAEYVARVVQTILTAPLNAAATPQVGRAVAGAMVAQLDGRMGDIASGGGAASFVSMDGSGDGARYADASSMQLAQTDAMPTLNGNSARKNGVAGFLRAGYGDGDRDATGNRAGFDYRIYTATAGVDYALNATSYVGLALGFADASASLADGAGHSSQQSWSLTAFGVKKIDALRFDVQAGAAYDDYSDLNRKTGFASDPVATGSTNGNTVFLSGRAGYAVNMGAYTVEPFTSLRYTRVSMKSYTETGGGILSLQYGRQRASNLVGTLGVEASTEWQMGTSKITPTLRLAFDRDLHQGSGILSYGFAGSASYRTEGSEPYLTTGHIGGGLSMDLQPGLVARVGYDTTFLGGGKDQYVNGHVSFAF